MRLRFLTILALLSFASQVQAEAAKRPAIRLVLAISIDQMRYDYLERFVPLFQHGLKTLLKNGAVFSGARYRHANNETGPGHAVLLSGMHGSHSGIISNTWYDSFLKKPVNVVDDPLYPALGGKGRAASPANFIGFTVGDILKLKSPSSKVVGVSAKDRAAILMVGKKADAAYWFEKGEGRYVTSTYYMKRVPAWLDEWNSKHFADAFVGKAWERLSSDVKRYEKYAGIDDAPGEWDGKNTIFPHYLRGNRGDAVYYDDFLRTPFVDEMILDFAIRARDAHRLGEGGATDLLAISFSATDYIGHTYGPDSQEMMDQILRLDEVLGKLLHEIDQRVGLSKTLVLLSADHGVLPLVEHLQAQGLPAKRVAPAKLSDLVNVALAKRFPGHSGLIAFADPPSFWLNKTQIRESGLSINDVEQEVIRALRASDLIESVYRGADFLSAAPSGDPDFELRRNSFFATRSPDIVGSVKEYVYVDERGGGTGHGTAFDYDRHVPIVFMGPGVAPGSYKAECGPEDIAPTLALILGLQYTKEDDARILKEMLSAAQK